MPACPTCAGIARSARRTVTSCFNSCQSKGSARSSSSPEQAPRALSTQGSAYSMHTIGGPSGTPRQQSVHGSQQSQYSVAAPSQQSTAAPSTNSGRSLKPIITSRSILSELSRQIKNNALDIDEIAATVPALAAQRFAANNGNNPAFDAQQAAYHTQYYAAQNAIGAARAAVNAQEARIRQLGGTASEDEHKTLFDYYVSLLEWQIQAVTLRITFMNQWPTAYGDEAATRSHIGQIQNQQRGAVNGLERAKATVANHLSDQLPRGGEHIFR
ncbi:hypothetical protein M011DRAFT_462982 [Sporormia fimetaria CBS 119925]|uniref:Uncharacterized protein n=1 Tax=Sporormia fimetaria CBS 119925 TaxID=1340428 RepID=A0A6A6UXS2_9PLEO|nr:hypothetical protein M011DRAFT_462982 [Sporormia fimetaria CBS 119925]